MASGLASKLSSWLQLPVKRRQSIKNDEENTQSVKKQRLGRANDVARRSTPLTTCLGVFSLSKQQSAILHKEARRKDHGMGWFINLPTELLHIVFQYLDKETLQLFSSLSKELNSNVIWYFLSIPGLVQLLNIPHKNKGIFKCTGDPFLFSNAGKLLASVSTCLSITKRLRIICSFKEKVERTSSDMVTAIVSPKTNENFGQFFSNYVSNWSDRDKKKAFCLFSKIMKLEQRINRILRFCPGKLPWHERELRQLLSQTLVNPSSSSEEDYGFWLTQILRPYPIIHQARLLYILTGATDQTGFVCWYCTCGCIDSIMVKADGSKHDLSELAKTFQILLGRPSDWSMDNVISIFDELTIIPCGWCLEKVACLLVNSGDDFSRAVIGYKAVNSHTAAEELSLMLYHMAQYCLNSKEEKLSKWYVDLLLYTVKQIPNGKERRKFTTTLFTSWHDCCSILFDEQYNSNDEETDICEVSLRFNKSLTSLAKLTSTLLDRALDL